MADAPLNFTLEDSPPPLEYTSRGRPRIQINFSAIAIGRAARVTRSRSTVAKHMYRYLATPAGKGKKFVLRVINPDMTRIYRVK
jgi:hypothetical protein